jgi:uncharacterized membrane protein
MESLMRRSLQSRWPWTKRPKRKHPVHSSIAKIVDRNIRVVDEYRADVERQKGVQQRIADWITHWSGSMLFVYLHVLWFGGWIIANVGWLSVEPFDPFPYGLLTTFVSLEAIFLSTFVLVSQNRQAELADRRSELDLQVNLLAEYEMTRVLTLVETVAKKLGCDDCDDEELEELKEDVKPEELLQELDSRTVG